MKIGVWFGFVGLCVAVFVILVFAIPMVMLQYLYQFGHDFNDFGDKHLNWLEKKLKELTEK